MSHQIACMLCSIDPGAVSLVVPVAQATIITLPIFFRDQIRRGAGAILARGRADQPRSDPDPEAVDDPVIEGDSADS